MRKYTRRPLKMTRVESLKEKVNNLLKSEYYSQDARAGMCIILESTLMESNNYKGFRYLNDQQLPKGVIPGIREGKDQFVNTDPYRREYF